MALSSLFVMDVPCGQPAVRGHWPVRCGVMMYNKLWRTRERVLLWGLILCDLDLGSI